MSVYRIPDIERLIRERDGFHEQLQFLASECDTLKRERDEARKLADYYASGFTEEAEAAGYRRGVQDAAREAEMAIFPSKPTIRAILTLLEKEKAD